jgi:hypothetical protein
MKFKSNLINLPHFFVVTAQDGYNLTQTYYTTLCHCYAMQIVLWEKLRDKEVIWTCSSHSFIHSFPSYIHIWWPPGGARRWGGARQAHASVAVAGLAVADSCWCQVITKHMFYNTPPWTLEHCIEWILSLKNPVGKIWINTIKDELHAAFVSLKITIYLAILGVNVRGRFKISGEVHLQVRYKPSVTWVLN